MANAKTAAAVKEAEVVNDEVNLPANPFEGWSEEQLGFPPYFKAAIGKGFFARVITVDVRDPEFIRFVLQYLGMPNDFKKPTQLDTTTPLKCQKGKKDDAEDVMVKPGEFFTTSNYGGLPLENFLGESATIACTGKVSTGKPNDMYTWTVLTSAETKTRLAAQRLEEMRTLRGRPKADQLNP